MTDTEPATARGASRVGDRFEATVGAVAHGGHFVVRHEGVVVFVRHALPGERVVVEVTDGVEGDRFWRGDAVTVLSASAHRVAAPCRFAGPGSCGGCDFQHVAVPAQRELKAAVVREQMQRLAGLDVSVIVECVPGAAEGLGAGLGWRTRVQYAVTADGTPGLRRHRSHDVVPVDRCLIAHPGLPPVTDRFWPGAASVEALVSGTGEQLRIVSTGDRAHFEGPRQLTERAAGRDFRVTGSAFWQVHPGAADVLTEAVLAALAPRTGERAVDLYSGVGLFTAALARAVGPTGSVVGVETGGAVVRDAEANLADLRAASMVQDRVDRWVRHGLGDGVDLVVLDPPRTGAKRPVVRHIAAARPRAVAYVACDPAALARDVAYFAESGYRLASLRAFDLFPMTHHVECVALLEKTGSDLRRSDSR